MPGNYPSVGIHVDLNEIAQLQAALSSATEKYVALGNAIEATGKRATSSSKAQREATKAQAQAERDAEKEFTYLQGVRVRTHLAAQRAQEAAEKWLVGVKTAYFRQEQRDAEARDNEIVRSAKRAADEQDRIAEQTYSFRRRMTAQRVGDAERAATAEVAAARKAAEEQQRADEMTTSFRRRMTAQRIAQAEEEAAATIRENERALADFRSSMDQRVAAGQKAANAIMRQNELTFAFQRRMTAQRIASVVPDVVPGGGGGGIGGILGVFANAGGAIGALRNGLGELRRAFFDTRVVVGLFMASLVVGPIVQAADAMQALEARTRLYAQRATDVPYTFEAIYRTAQATRTPLEAVATLYTRLAPLAQQLGRSQLQILRTVQTVSEAFQIGGATPEESRSSSQQLAQALASNRLGGDELRSLAENAPVLVSRIAAALNMNTGQFINWAHAGHANTRVIVDAIDQAQTDIDRMFRTLPVTIGQSLTIVSNAFTHLVGEANKATGASTAVAAAILDFGHFLESASVLNTVTAAINGTRVALGLLGQAFSLVGRSLPTITSIIAVMVGAQVIPPILIAVRAQMLAMAASMAVAGGSAGLFGGAMTLAGTAAASFGRSVGAVVTMLGGPFGVAVIAAVAGLNLLIDANNRAKAVAGEYRDAQETSSSAIMNAITFADHYNLSTTSLTATLNTLTGATNTNTNASDAAMQMALARANAERLLTAQLLERAAAEEGTVARHANDSVNGIMAVASRASLRMNTNSFIAGDPETQALAQRAYNARLQQDADNRRIGASALGNMAALTIQAATLRGTPVTVTQAAAGDGHGTPAAAAAGHGPTAGGLNAIERMRAEVAGLNAQIQALGTDPLSDLAARINAAGEAARAARENGRNSPLADEAASLAMLKEEATIRLQLTQALIQQTRASNDEAAASTVSMAANRQASNVLTDYYQSGETSLSSYADALARAHQAELQGQVSQAELTIAQQYGVTTIDEISAAYQRSTHATEAQADALQATARETLNARLAAIALADQQARMADANARINESNAQIDQLERYTAALDQGTFAIAAYNREQAIRQELDAHKGLTVGQATSIVDNTTVATERNRSAEMDRQLRLANLTTREREQEARVGELLAAQMAQLGVSASDLSDTVRQQYENQARITAELEAQRKETADLKVSIQDSVRQAFIESGHLDFSSLREGVTQALRRAIYDSLLAKPINIVINAVVDIATSAIRHLLDQVMASANSNGGLLDSLKSVFSGGKSGIGSLFSGDMGGAISGFTKAAGGIVSAVQKLAPAAMAAYAGYQVGRGIAGAIGIDTTSAGGRTGGYVGGGVGAVAGLILGGPIGAAIGATIGSVIGSAIGNAINGPNDPSATNSVRLVNGRFQAGTTFVDDHGPGDEVTALSNNVAKALQAAATSFGVDLSKAGNFSTAVGYVATGRKGYRAAGFFGGDVAGADYNSSNSSLRQALYKNGAEFYGVQDSAQLTTQLVKEFLADAQASGALNLTDAEAALIAAATNLDEAAQTIKDARAVAGGVASALLKYTNPREAALTDLRAQQIARRQGILNYASQGLISQSQLAQINSDLGALERYEVSDVIAQFATTVGGATHSLQDFVDAQKKIRDYVTGLATSSLSPLSPEAQLQSAGNSFFSTLSSARGGNYDSLNGLTDVAQTYLGQAQAFYGSSAAYNAIFNTVTDALTQVADQTAVDPNTQATLDALAELNAAVLSSGAAIVVAINDNTTSGATVGGAPTAASLGMTQEQFDLMMAQLAAIGLVTAQSSQDNAAQIAASIAASGFMGSALGGGNLMNAY